MKVHSDLWGRIQSGIVATGKKQIAVKKVKGHMNEEDCHEDEQLLEEIRKNDQADKLQ